MEKAKTSKKLIIAVALLFLFCSLILIGVGLYFHSLSKPINIVQKTITETSSYLKPYVFIEEDDFLKNSFTIDSDITMTINSEYITKLGANDPEYKAYDNMIRNLSLSKSKLHVARDMKNEKVFINFTNSVNTNKLDYRFVIDDATGYYKTGDMTTYVNTGTNNYFESLSNEISSTENNKYLYDFITSKIPTYITENDITNTTLKTTINGKEINTNQISIKLTNDLLNNVKNNLYKDLKEDSKAKSIIEGYDAKFFKHKQKSTKFLDSNQGLTLNIYTTTVLSKVVKIELIYSDNTDRTVITYEKVDDNNSYITTRENDKLLSKLDITHKGNDLSIKVKDSKDKEIGTISLTKSTNSLNINLDLNIDNEKLIATYQLKRENVKKNSYNRKDIITIKYLQDKTVKLDMKIDAKSKVENSADIKEEVGDAILEKKLTDEQREKIDNYLTSYLLELSK